MKGKEIIDHIIRAEMPDIEQVREKCFQQEVNITHGYRRQLRWSTVAAAFVMFLVLSTVVYAAAVFIGQRFDTGGSMEFIFVDEEGFTEFWGDSFGGAPIYRSPRGIIRDSEFLMFAESKYWAQFDADTAHLVNELLEGRIFTADGSPFQLVVPIANWEWYPLMYRADDRGDTLFNIYGEEIDTIFVFLRFDDGTPEWADILNEEDAISQGWHYSDTFEDAVRVLGNIRLPVLEGFDEPVFEVIDIPGHYRDTGYEYMWLPDFRNVFIRYRPVGESWHMGFMLFVEPIRSESEASTQLPVQDGVVHEHAIADTTIYEIIGHGQVNLFVWHYDGLVYRLSPSGNFNTAQSLEIIRSMIE